MKPLGIIITGSVPFSKMMKESEIIHQDIQFSINFKDEQYSNDKLTQKKLFDLINQKKELPKTSQPSYTDIKSVLEKRLKEYKQLILIVPSRELSGTYQGTKNVVKEINEETAAERVFVVESSSIALSEIDNVEEILQVSNNIGTQQLVDNLKVLNNVTYAFPTDEKFLKISGRVSGSQALLIGMLKIRAVVCMEPYKKPFFPYKGRGLKSILKYIDIHLIKDGDTIKKVILTKISLPKFEEKEIIKLFEKKNIDYEVVDDAPAVVATHFGPNSFGIYIKRY